MYRAWRISVSMLSLLRRQRGGGTKWLCDASRPYTSEKADASPAAFANLRCSRTHRQALPPSLLSPGSGRKTSPSAPCRTFAARHQPESAVARARMRLRLAVITGAPLGSHGVLSSPLSRRYRGHSGPQNGVPRFMSTRPSAHATAFG